MTYCADKCRPLFEQAALAQYEEDPGVAGQKLGDAQIALYECLGITPSIELAMDEVERWFSFFGWWYSAKLLREDEPGQAWTILTDLAESFSPVRSVELGIAADYGTEQVAELHKETMQALALIQDEQLLEAASHADKAADIQYRLAAERAGTSMPG